MRFLIALLGVVLIVIVLWDAFEAIVLPRRVARRLRLTRLFYRTVWGPWWVLADRVKKRRRRVSVLGVFGPISLVLLLALWAAALLLGFAMIHWGIATAFSGQNHPGTFLSDLYFSGTTFFTLGLGDITPLNRGGRIMTVIESGTGLGLLALVIGYFPVLYQAFSRREVHIAMLDTCSLVMVGVEGVPKWQAQLTFKMARHAVVDLAQIFNTSPVKDGGERLSEAELDQLRLVLSQSGVALQEVPGDKSLNELRAMYEPYVKVLSQYLMMPLPPWIPMPKAVDNWQTSAWEITAAGSDSIRKCMVRGATAEAVRLTKAAALKSSEL